MHRISFLIIAVLLGLTLGHSFLANVGHAAASSEPPDRSGHTPAAFNGQILTGTLALTTTLSEKLYFPQVSHQYPPLCPAFSNNHYDLLSTRHGPIDHPDSLHADLNLKVRGYGPISDTLDLILYDGATDPDPPQLPQIFSDQRLPEFKALYRVYDWIWDPAQCGGNPHGCQGNLITPGPGHFWESAVLEVAARPGEPLYMPWRNATLNTNSYRALVLYADTHQITINYTRDDSIAHGFAVHLNNICVDPQLLNLYRTQVNPDGYRRTRNLPVLRNGQPIGTAWIDSMQIAVRDRGQFMDPRSQKDWWRQYPQPGTLRLNIEHTTE